MSTTGTIGRPAPHGPVRDLDTTPTMNEPTTAGRPRQKLNRTRKLQLIPEALARSHMAERVREAESQRVAGHVARAARLQRRSRRLQERAERASRRARRALAQAVIR
ncbi:hypothetical protein [Streptomyces radicis]|uniref:Uncharacterized protein n=1 Tax=Streptomyces radicis TaxID=1750517 RepID=A0A3A9W8H7_9ACTN|nr:hypothetical protein [Streptomyces radicis]RKN09002.1 hypothetical protein D7319_13790 [Streptomyces radicis]RKN22807.1 hypothetical protein D7318_14765 [Streptomyces radicis]